jgi:hypothetical protein
MAMRSAVSESNATCGAFACVMQTFRPSREYGAAYGQRPVSRPGRGWIHASHCGQVAVCGGGLVYVVISA